MQLFICQSTSALQFWVINAVNTTNSVSLQFITVSFDRVISSVKNLPYYSTFFFIQYIGQIMLIDSIQRFSLAGDVREEIGEEMVEARLKSSFDNRGCLFSQR